MFRSWALRWLRRLLYFLLILLLTAGVVAWWQRHTLMAWYAVRGLQQAGEPARAAWITRIAEHPRAALPFLFASLRKNDHRSCDNVKQCLLQLWRGWNLDDPRRTQLMQLLAQEFGRFSSIGQKATLELANSLGPTVPVSLAPPLASLILQASSVEEETVRDQALTLATSLATQPASSSSLNACRELARACLHDTNADNRGRALRLAIQPSIDLREQVAPLLSDPSPEIRRTAMVVLGPATEVISTDDLLHWLHDPDAEVRHLCESALRGRGLRKEHLLMGRLMTDPQVTERLKVLDVLQQANDVEPGVWLRRLSHDPAPAVRAATVRLAAEQTVVNLADRIEQMAQNDPSHTVRQIAQFYLACRKAE
jgi:hypothetical protein